MELTTINPQEYGLTTQTATSIVTAFAPIELEFTALVQEYLQVIQMDLEEAIQPAKDLKAKYITTEKGVNAIHKTQKEFFLSGGRFVDANKNRYAHLITEHKKILDNVIKQEEIKKKAEQKKISDARHLELSQYMKDTSHIDLATMQEDVYQAFLSSKKVDFEREQELQRSNEIIAQIYQSNDLSSFNVELFGEHINARKKQLHDAKLLEISNYTQGKLSFELDTEELQQAYNNRLLVLDGLRVERIKANMLNAYNNALNTIRRDVYSYVVPNIEVREFTQEWEAYKVELLNAYNSRVKEIENIVSKMQNVVINGSNVLLSDGFIFCNVNQLNIESIKLFNDEQQKIKSNTLSEEQLFIDWINSFTLNETTLNNNKVTEVKQKFESFKKWALNLKH